MDFPSNKRVSRRLFLVLTGSTIAAATGAMAACQPTTPTAPAPKAAAPASGPAPGPKVPASAAQPVDKVPTVAPAAAQQAPSTPKTKTLIVASGREVPGFSFLGRNETEIQNTATGALVTRDTEKYEVVPWMAEELPSLTKGTWKVNPDGTMVTTWRLKPDIKWHDGTPFSSKDFVFGWEVVMNPNVKINNRVPQQWIERMETPDDRTLVIHWKQRYAYANELFRSHLWTVPRHILEEPYKKGDWDAFHAHPFFTNQYVGVGPYKVVDIQKGSHVEFAADPNYFLGKPKVDRIIWRFTSDTNTALSSILAGEVDVALRDTLTMQTGIVADREWAQKGQGTIKFTPINWYWLNPSATNPFFGWEAPNQNKVRQAMLHALNREEFVTALSDGKESVCHFPLAPVHPAYKAADAVVTKYAYDPKKAEQLLAEAGWKKGPDGILVNDRGERFSVEFRIPSGDSQEEQEQQAMAADLKRVGIETKIANLPARQDDSEEFRNRWPGLYYGSHNIVPQDWAERFHSREIPNEQEAWASENVSQWRSADKLIDEFASTLEESKRNELTVEFMKLFTTELPHLPIKHASEVTAWKKGVTGVPVRYESGGENYRTWNIHTWDIA